jgi:large subunit ribosomal protein L9
MQVILLKDVEKLGLRGDVVDVADGYGRNFLLPRQLAQKATPGALKDVQRRQELQARHEAATVGQAQQIAGELAKTELRFEVQAGPTGTLFGSVTPSEIADEIWKQKKIRVDRRKVGTDPIKRIGRYQIPIELFQDVSVEVRTLVVPEGGELPPEEELQAMAAAEAAANAPAEPAATDVEALIGEAEAAGIDVAVAAAAAQDFEPSDTQEVDETPEMHAEERPDDEFDRAADSALEREGEEL